MRIDFFVRATYFLKDTISSHSSRRFGPALVTLENSRLLLPRLIFASWLFRERSSHVSMNCRIQRLVKEGSHQVLSVWIVATRAHTSIPVVYVLKS